VPTLLGVLAAVLVVAAVQVQVRAVREPGLAHRHGAAYRSYEARTGRFLPRPGHRGATDTAVERGEDPPVEAQRSSSP
jgi:steroid 5-alpha reductase family enzyme